MKVDQARSRALLYALTFLFFSFLSAYTNAQEKSSLVKGIVQNNNGQSLAGVSVIIRNTSTNFTSGTSTDSSGVFTFSKIPSGGPYTFSFSIIGYDAQTLSGYNIKEGITLSLVVKMQESGGTTLNQVVVVGYGTQRKADVTVSVATVSTKGLSSLPVPNIGEAIEGKAAGVQVISSGSPGSNVTFRVRGTGTINNSDPLLVIDGVPTDAPINNINTDDIASIDILKDASATAIYGSRGANGVILITTKKGSSGRGRLSFTAYAGVQNATHVVQMLNARQFAMFNNEMLANNNQATNPAYANPIHWARAPIG
jgi:TonB-dependent SusC/RagA subfamily outer membrane receptor